MGNTSKNQGGILKWINVLIATNLSDNIWLIVMVKPLQDIIVVKEYPFMKLVRVDTVPLKKKTNQKSLMEF